MLETAKSIFFGKPKGNLEGSGIAKKIAGLGFYTSI
jgi:hypothetical protein